MTDGLLAIEVKIESPDGTVRSGLQMVFTGSAVVYRDADGNQYEMAKILGMKTLHSPTLIGLLQRKYGS